MTTTENRTDPATGTGPDPATGTERISAVPLLLAFGRGEGPRLVLACAFGAASALAGLVPFLVAYLIVDELLGDSVDGNRLWLYGALTVAAIVVRAVLFAASMWVSHIAAYTILYRVRISVSEALARLPLGFFSRRRSGALKKTMADDVEALEIFLAHAIPEGVVAATAVAASSVILFVADWRLALATLVVVPIAILALSGTSATAQGRVNAYHRSGERMNAALVEFLAGMLVVRLFNRSGDRHRRTETAVLDHERFETDWARDVLVGGTLYFVALGANALFILPLGLVLHDNGSVSLSVLVLFVVLGLGYTQPLIKLQGILNQLSMMGAGGKAINDLLDEPPLPDRPGDREPVDDTIEFRDVCFSYGAGEALSGVSFVARAGEVTALVGPSGAGKTTIARLVARFWDVGSGSVSVGGVDVREVGVAALMDRVAFIFQDSFLFHDTIAANIAFGRPDASPEEIERVAGLARCHDFIRDLPDGYASIVGEGGSTLSGGQRQRVAIARALLKDAPIVILDEATAHADPENETAIQAAIAEATAGRTLLVIAHRLSTIADADQIVVVEDGRIAERGRHQDLLERGGLYSRLWADHIAGAGWSLRGSAEQAERGSADLAERGSVEPGDLEEPR